MEMYFIALVSPAEINKKVLEWKNYMKDRFGCLVALKSPAHITLVPPFWMDPQLESELENTINLFSSEQELFDIELRNFSAFAPRVLFLDIPANPRLIALQRDFIDFLLQQNKYSVTKDARPFHPHVTIAARDLYKKAFHEAWEIFSKKKYEARWRVSGISLLKHNKKNWDVIFTSRFPA